MTSDPKNIELVRSPSSINDHPIGRIQPLPSRERIHIPPGEKENHRLKSAVEGGYVGSLEGIDQVFLLPSGG